MRAHLCTQGDEEVEEEQDAPAFKLSPEAVDAAREMTRAAEIERAQELPLTDQH